MEPESRENGQRLREKGRCHSLLIELLSCTSGSEQLRLVRGLKFNYFQKLGRTPVNKLWAEIQRHDKMDV